MHFPRLVSLSVVVILFVQPLPATADDVPAAMTGRVSQLHAWASDAAIREAVAAQNASGLTHEEILRRDDQWRKSDKSHPLKAEAMKNACANSLLGFAKSDRAVLETFVMDNQGALVCTLLETSDYWQGDEAKWQKSFVGETGTDYIAEPEYDESTKATLVQISVPILNEGKLAGVLMVGLNARLMRADSLATQK